MAFFSNRLFTVFVFFRRHWWRFVLAFALVGFLFWLVWNIPNFILAFGRVGEDKKPKVEDDKSSSVSPDVAPGFGRPNFPVCYIICPKGLYTDLGFFAFGSKIGPWSLNGYDDGSGVAFWKYDDGINSFSGYAPARRVVQNSK